MDLQEPGLEDLLESRPALSMDAMDGLCLDGVALNAIADKYGTPVWVYGAESIRLRYRTLAAAMKVAKLPAHIHYAVKANDHLAILGLMRSLGAGADVVSLGEFLRARRAGIAAQDIVFSGVGKTMAEIEAALAGGVGQLNAESAEELEMISAAAGRVGVVANVALRMNPDVDAGTHGKITTGLKENKFGIAALDILELYARAAAMPGIKPVGLALHIGSQITTPAPYARAYAKAAQMVKALRAAGQSVELLDLGGGLGIGYGDEEGISVPAYASMLTREVASLKLKLLLEPGRYLVGPAGVLLASVILEKTGEKRFMVLDAAMNELMRPALYDAWHGILPLSAVDFKAELSAADVVGPVCESADCFAYARQLPVLAAGARVAILDAGAYGAVMSSAYNARPKAAAVLIDQGRFQLITPRQKLDDLWADEVLPESV